MTSAPGAGKLTELRSLWLGPGSLKACGFEVLADMLTFSLTPCQLLKNKRYKSTARKIEMLLRCDRPFVCQESLRLSLQQLTTWRYSQWKWCRVESCKVPKVATHHQDAANSFILTRLLMADKLDTLMTIIFTVYIYYMYTYSVYIYDYIYNYNI